MTVRIIHKAGDSFSQGATAFQDLAATTPRNLSNVTITAYMTAPMQTQYDFTITKTDAVNGEFTISADETDTVNWRPTVWTARISYAEAGDIVSTEAFQIEVVGDYNAAA